MPRRDGSGPMGAGAMTGRGLGFCEGADNNVAGEGRGLGLGRGMGFGRGLGAGRGYGMACRAGRGRARGFGRGLGMNRGSQSTDQEWLNEQKSFLQNRLDWIDKQLENQ